MPLLLELKPPCLQEGATCGPPGSEGAPSRAVLSGYPMYLKRNPSPKPQSPATTVPPFPTALGLLAQFPSTPRWHLPQGLRTGSSPPAHGWGASCLPHLEKAGSWPRL